MSDSHTDPNDGVPIYSSEDEAKAILGSVGSGSAEGRAADVALRFMRAGWNAETLDAEPSLSEGQADTLHHEEDGFRLWLSRTGVADGEPFENTVSIEQDQGGKWVTVCKYDGGELPDEDEDEVGWSAQVVAETFVLSIKLGNAAMQTRDDVAAALRAAADSMQSNIELDGRIRDDNGNGVGWWAYEDDPRPLSGDCFAFRGELEVYAADADEAKELAKEVCEFIAEPVSFGCTANVGGEQAPPALKLPAIHGYQEGC